MAVQFLLSHWLYLMNILVARMLLCDCQGVLMM